MASKKIFQAVLCPTQLFQWKLICTFNQHCLSYKISNRLQFNSPVFFFSENSSKLCCIDITFSKMCRTVKRLLSTWRPIHIFSMGTLVIVYQKNAPLRYKTTCSESESRNCDCQWTLVSFFVKHNQFYREARLTCPLYRSTEDICIGICVFERISTYGTCWKKSVSM